MTDNQTEKTIYRQVAFPESAFDYLKTVQREHEQAHGFRLNNNQTLALILAEHQQQNVARGVRNAGIDHK